MFKRSGIQKQFQIDDIKLDPETNQVWRGSDEIVLPKLSFKLLKVLAENSPNILEQEELIGEIWTDMVVGNETLKQRVRLLRKALDDSTKPPKYIGAVRGRGYRLLPDVKILLVNQITPIEYDLACNDYVPNLLTLSTDKIWRYISITLTAFIFILISTMYLLSIPQSNKRSLKHLAILPFVNITQNKEDDYLVSGMADELILVMSEIDSLVISSKTATQHYQQNKRVVSEIADRLEVGSILNGTLYRQDDLLHFNFKLIDSNNSQQLWQAEYDFASDDILAIQRKVITQVTKHLKAQLNPAQLLDSLVLTQPTKIVKAYDFYLKGRSYYERYRQTDNLTAIQLYQQALDLDNQFPLAYAGIADAYSQGVYQFGASDNWRKLSLLSAKKAVELDNTKAESHKALSLAFYLNGDLEQAIMFSLRAIKIAPSHIQAVTNLAYLYQQTGQLEKAKQWNTRALEIAPQYAPAWTHQGQTLESLGKKKQAEDNYKKALQLQPDYALTKILYANYLNLNDRTNEAVILLENALNTFPNEYEYLLALGKIYLYTGQYQSAEKYFKDAVALQPSNNNLELELYLSIAQSVMTNQGLFLTQNIIQWKQQRTLSSDNPQDYFVLGLALAAQKADKPSLTALIKAIQLGWTNYSLIEQTELLKHLWLLPDLQKAITQRQDNNAFN